jgi:hypothetical protein
MPEATSPVRRVPVFIGEAAKSPNLGGAGILKDKGLSGLALAGHASLVRREPCRSCNLSDGHLVKPADFYPGLSGQYPEVSN